MAIEIRVPRLGWSMEEGVFQGWLKADGANVKAGDALYELEGEKATQEIESLDAGVLRIPADAPRKGDTVAVGALLGYLLAEGEALPSAAPAAATEKTPLTARKPTEVASPDRQSLLASSAAITSSSVRASPRARRVANSLGIDWRTLTGSGRNGRVRERDVRAAVGETSAVPITRRRRLIAERMLAGVREAAPVTLTTRADATALVALRQSFQSARAEATVPTYTDLLVVLTASALSQHRMLAGRWSGENILLPQGDHLHIGIAVDTEEGLLVPVLRDVPSRSLEELVASSRDLVDRARLGTLRAEEMQGGVFTVTNLGGYGIDAFAPIINLPETAILGVGAIRWEPVAQADGQWNLRHLLTLSLTFDHRVVDGAPAARFLADVVAKIESPQEWLH